MNEKKIIPCIYLYNKTAVKGLKDLTLVNADPLTLAKFYASNSADALLIFDMSSSDEEHEEALDLIKSICVTVDIPVYGAGNVKRMEDIKKLLYAGCNKAALNYSKQSNIDITEEVSKKFGKDKIMIKDAKWIAADADFGSVCPVFFKEFEKLFKEEKKLIQY